MNMENYKKIYDEYFKLARKIANDVLHDYYLAGDVAQEVFIEMFLKRESLDESQIKYWIILNASRRAIDQLRKINRRRETDISRNGDGELSCESASLPEAAVLRNEEIHYKCAALDELRAYNENWYQYLMRNVSDETSYRKMARSCGLEETNLRVQVCRARKWLNKKIRDLYQD